MDRYARMLIHFMHAVTNDRDRVHTFLFGTRLTNVTRHLRQKDIDVALEKVTGSVLDWSGGTRIGECLHQFNRDWSRRVLGQGAVVLFISDGLDRDAGDGVGREMKRLHGSCRRLISCGMMVSNPNLWVCGRCCRMSTISARFTTSTAWPPLPMRSTGPAHGRHRIWRNGEGKAHDRNNDARP